MSPSLFLSRRLSCGLALLLALPLTQAAEVELVSGFNFGQFIFVGEPTTDALNGTVAKSIKSNFAGDTAPGPEDSGYYKLQNNIEESFSAGVATLYWNGTHDSDSWTHDTGVSVYEHGSLQAVNHTLVNDRNMFIGDDTNFALRFTSGTKNEFSLVVNTDGWSDFDPAAFDQPNDYNFTFSAFAHSGSSAVIEWFLDGVSIGSFTARSGDHQPFNLDLPSSFYGNNSATLVARVTGDLVIDNIQINGVAAQPPVFTNQPDSQTVTAGANASFTVAVTGAPSPTYRWEKNGVRLANGSGVSGATTATLTLTNVAPNDAGSYTVVVGNNGATAESAAAVLVVQTVPSFESQPFDVVANPGESTTFTVSASGNPAPSYQWRKDGADLVDSATISGATTATLTLSNLVTGDAGVYTVVITNAVTSTVSAPATLTVTEDAIAPFIQSQPSDTSVIAGNTATFTVTATGAPAPTYQWRHNGADLTDGDGVSGATTATLQLTGVVKAREGAYTVFVSNSAGNLESTAATLTVFTVPSITSAPARQTVTLGERVLFSVTASGSPAPTYQWRKAGVPIPGATRASYTIDAAALSDAARYSVVVTNRAGEVISADAALLVIAPASITRQPTTQTTAAGDSVSFTVKARGTPSPDYQWRKNGVAIPGATAATYTLPSVQASDAGAYTVVVTNRGGRVVSVPARLFVSVPVKIDADARQVFAPGSRLSIDSRFTPTAAASLRFQWFLNGKPIKGATSPNYDIAKAQASHSGTYSLRITTANGRLLMTQTIAQIAITLANTYDGLLLDPDSGEPVGRLELSVAADGAYTGRLLFEDGGAYPVKGTFLLNAARNAGTAFEKIKRSGSRKALELDLTLDGLTGEVDAGVSAVGSSDLLGAGVATPRANHADWAGSYHLLLSPAPSSTGARLHATATIDASGLLRLAGKTAGGHAFEVSVPGGVDGAYAIFVQPASKSAARLAGVLNLVPVNGSYQATFASSGFFYEVDPAAGIDLKFKPTFTPAVKP